MCFADVHLYVPGEHVIQSNTEVWVVFHLSQWYTPAILYTHSPWLWLRVVLFDLLIFSTWHFFTLKLIGQILAHFESWSISCWMMHWSSRDVTCLYKTESAAKRRKVDLISLFISFIYTRKSRGPRDRSTAGADSVIFFLSMLRAWAVFNCLIWGFWVMR